MGLYWNSSPWAPIASQLLLENFVKSWYKALQIKQSDLLVSTKRKIHNIRAVS